MKPIRYETDAEKNVTRCVNYMREWFDVPAPEWVQKKDGGTEKIHLVSDNDTLQLDLPFDGYSENNDRFEHDEINIANFGLATSLMVERLRGKDNPSDEYISAIGFRIATTVMQEIVEPITMRVA